MELNSLYRTPTSQVFLERSPSLTSFNSTKIHATSAPVRPITPQERETIRLLNIMTSDHLQFIFSILFYCLVTTDELFHGQN